MHSMRSFRRQVELGRPGNQLPVLSKANLFCKIVKCCVCCQFVFARDKYIPGYRCSGKIRLASRRDVLQYKLRPWRLKNTNSRFLRFFVRSVPLFRSLMLTPMRTVLDMCVRSMFVRCTIASTSTYIYVFIGAETLELTSH